MVKFLLIGEGVYWCSLHVTLKAWSTARISSGGLCWRGIVPSCTESLCLWQTFAYKDRILHFLHSSNQHHTVKYASHSTVPFSGKLDPIPALVHGGSHGGFSRMALRDGKALQYCLFAAPPPQNKNHFQRPASDRFPARLTYQSSSLLIMRIASLVEARLVADFEPIP